MKQIRWWAGVVVIVMMLAIMIGGCEDTPESTPFSTAPRELSPLDGEIGVARKAYEVTVMRLYVERDMVKQLTRIADALDRAYPQKQEQEIK